MSVGRGWQRTTVAATWGETTATKGVRGATTKIARGGPWRQKGGCTVLGVARDEGGRDSHGDENEQEEGA